MPRKSLETQRRTELTAAAFTMLCEDGLAATTLTRVAQSVGVTKGMVLHYFGSKDALFEAVMLFLNAQLRDDMIVMMRHAQSPIERLFGVIEANFSPSSFQPLVCHAWLALCAEVPQNADYQRIQQILHARLQSNLASGMASIETATVRRQHAKSLVSLIDGLWLRNGLQVEEISREEARTLAADWVKRFLPEPDLVQSRAKQRMRALAETHWPIAGSGSHPADAAQD